MLRRFTLTWERSCILSRLSFSSSVLTSSFYRAGLSTLPSVMMTEATLRPRARSERTTASLK
jgi:hypothetical protein